MILVLNIINRQKAEWLLVRNSQIVYQQHFALQLDQDRVLVKLFFLLKKNKLKVQKIKSFVLLFQSGSLTQIKVMTAIINALAWQNNAKAYADYSFQGEVLDSLEGILLKVSKIKKFRPLKVVYAREPEITISQKKHKFKLIK